MEEKTKEELEAESAAEQAEFEATLEGLSDEEKSQKLAEREAEAAQKDIDFKKQLETLELEKKPDELEKAKRSLHFNAEKVKELGGDPLEVIQPELRKDEGELSDVDTVIDRKFAERDARSLAKSDDELKVIMWYVRNKGLSVEESHLLANKGKIANQVSELRRANATPSREGGAGRKVEVTTVPDRTPEEKQILERRGMRFNPKTKTFQGKFYEEFWDGDKWASRKLRR
jgi:hypothetical protein